MGETYLVTNCVHSLVQKYYVMYTYFLTQPREIKENELLLNKKFIAINQFRLPRASMRISTHLFKKYLALRRTQKTSLPFSEACH